MNSVIKQYTMTFKLFKISNNAASRLIKEQQKTSPQETSLFIVANLLEEKSMYKIDALVQIKIDGKTFTDSITKEFMTPIEIQQGNATIKP